MTADQPVAAEQSLPRRTAPVTVTMTWSARGGALPLRTVTR